jgi:hypothetical protein
MATTNVEIAGIESYQPAIDYRKTGRIGILRGRNFAWDASGVHAAFASRLVSGSFSIGQSPDFGQSIYLDAAIHVAMGNDIWRLVQSSEGSPIGTWQKITTLTPRQNPLEVDYNRLRWSSAYLGFNRYAAAWNYGVFRVNLGANPPTYTKILDSGLGAEGEYVMAIAETNGRMLYLTDTTVYWSAAAEPENLTPSLGGAGFQVLGERISGQPYAITPMSLGAVIWTSEGALVMEFIGGDAVFRFYQLNTNALPISAFAITRLPDDDYVMLTRLGLFMFNNASQPEPITPLFNEFLREYLRGRPNERGHLWYSITDNRLYVSMRESVTTFSETLCLDIMLDRWGIFSDRHLGFIDYGVSRGQLAYLDPQGIASYLLSIIDQRKDREIPSQPGQFRGLGSEVEIGWIRAENLVPHSDSVQELQEIVVYRESPFVGLETIKFDEGFIPTLTFTVGQSWAFGADGNLEGWTGIGCTLTVANGVLTVVSTADDPQIQSEAGLAINGGVNNKIRVKLRHTAGDAWSWDGTAYYATANHGYSGQYSKKIIPDFKHLKEWKVLEWDMANLTQGGNDWITNTITRLRLDLFQSSPDTLEIDHIIVGSRTAPDADVFDEGLISQAGIADRVDEGVLFGEEEPTDYELEVLTDLLQHEDADGNPTNLFPAELVLKGRNADTWVTMAPSYYFRLRFRASAKGQFFRLNALDCTFTYSGNVS